jgi:hypothetical protein
MHTQVQVTISCFSLPEKIDRMQHAAQAIQFHRFVVAGRMVQQPPDTQSLIAVRIAARETFVTDNGAAIDDADGLKRARQRRVEIAPLRTPVGIGPHPRLGLRGAV